ncbi:unnamed protein product [Pleuronectes platessa]|uniref:Uncharacterized protein n=1 Tax=Pleuronectes platessa TaxID=8262 RepID=A0A9N7VQX1_PLEPL|nr:unnamed protein product [Pleuronectes platessa]
MRGELIQAQGQTSVLHFFSKLRRHASLEGAGPFFRRWKFDSSHRAASLDAKGSPKRRPFQRQRAASETTDHTEDESLSLQDEVMESSPHTPIQTSVLQSLSAESLSHHTTTPPSSVFLSRLNLEAMLEVGRGSSTRREETCLQADDCPAKRHDEATTNGTGVETETKLGAVVRAEAVGVKLGWKEDDDPFGAPQEAAERFEDMLRKTNGAQTEGMDADVRRKNEADVDDGEDVVLGAEARRRADSGSSLSFMIRQESLEPPPSLYRDIWSLRASLEQYASSDQSSTDRESIRSDADSVSSYGGAGARSGLDSYLSQDLDDDPDGEGEGEVMEGGIRGASGGDTEMGSGAGGEGEASNRKLLQMDSGYASIEAPPRAPEEMRLFGTPGSQRGKTASERRLFFTNSGRKGSVCESIESKLFQEELEDEMADGTETEKLKARAHTCSQSLTLQEPYQLLKSLHPQKPPVSQSQLITPLMKQIPPPPSPHRPRLRHRDYSIDEKTDALFNEFLRHDPRFDQQESPLRSRHRSRVHLRKQWQRHKQYSDPGSCTGGITARSHASQVLPTKKPARLQIARKQPPRVGKNKDPSRDGVAANKTSEGTDAKRSSSSCAGSGGEGQGGQVTASKDSESTGSQSLNTGTAQTSCMDPRCNNRNNNGSQAILSEVSLQEEGSLSDKLAESVEERLYGGLRTAEKLRQGGSERVIAVSRTSSPGFSPI